jgi:type I restriction enzyme, S subunit
VSWPLVKLSDVAIVNPRLSKDADELQQVSFVAMASASDEGFLLSEESRVLKESKKGFTYFDAGDVLIAKITPCFENGKCLRPNQITNQIGFGSTEFHVLRAIPEKLDSTYLFYLMWSDRFRNLGEASMSGAAGQKRVGTDFLRDFEIPLPPLEEQKRIAAILDKADAIRRKRHQAIKLADDFLRSVFLEMFGDPVTNPKGWEVTSLSNLVSKLGDGLHGTPVYDCEGDYHFINGNNLDGGKVVIGEAVKRISQSEYEKHKKDLNENTMLVSINGTIGKVAFYNGEKIVLGKSACYFNLIQGAVNKTFLYHLISGDYFKNYVSGIVTGSTIKNVSLKSMREFPVLLPPTELQERFSAIEVRVKSMLSRCKNGQSSPLFETLSQQAFSGKL